MEAIKCSVCGKVLGFVPGLAPKEAKCPRCGRGTLPIKEEIGPLLAIHNLAHAVTLLIGHLHAHIEEDKNEVPDIDLEGLLNMVNKDAHDLTSELLEKQGCHPPHWMANTASQKEERKAKLAIVKKKIKNEKDTSF